MKRRTLLLAALLTACSATPPSNVVDDVQHDGSGDRAKPTYDKPETTPDDVASVVSSTNRFAMAMYRQLRETEGNMAFSPASISLALNMTRAGAKGETASQIAATLKIGIDDDRAHAAYGNLLHGWNHGGERPYQLAVANRLFGERTMELEKPFLSVTGERYGAELEPLSFKTAPESARESINDWIEARTNDRIQDLLPEGSIKKNTRLVLTNAVYFKGKWKLAFDEKATRDAAFHAPGGDVQVPMMNLTERFAYAEADGMRLVELPYQGDDLAMTLVVPDDPKGLRDVEEKLSEETLARWLDDAGMQEVSVSLPRFEIDPPEATKLKPALIAMGMRDAFDATKADLSGIADVGPTERLVIDDAYHKAFVEVNEEGTEAAAGTAVVVKTESAALAEPKRVNADRPFLFFIRDKKSGAILFMGRVEKPSAS